MSNIMERKRKALFIAAHDLAVDDEDEQIKKEIIKTVVTHTAFKYY